VSRTCGIPWYFYRDQHSILGSGTVFKLPSISHLMPFLGAHRMLSLQNRTELFFVVEWCFADARQPSDLRHVNLGEYLQ
jgi:hypothetical protein